MNDIQIDVLPQYIPEQSDPNAGQFVYAYTITIRNQGSHAATLLSRHWIITDANNKVQEVQGIGVIGEQPTISPQQSYAYTSGVVMETNTGMMSGTYTMQNENGEKFEAKIPDFALSQPGAMH